MWSRDDGDRKDLFYPIAAQFRYVKQQIRGTKPRHTAQREAPHDRREGHVDLEPAELRAHPRRLDTYLDTVAC